MKGPTSPMPLRHRRNRIDMKIKAGILRPRPDTAGGFKLWARGCGGIQHTCDTSLPNRLAVFCRQNPYRALRPRCCSVCPQRVYMRDSRLEPAPSVPVALGQSVPSLKLAFPRSPPAILRISRPTSPASRGARVPARYWLFSGKKRAGS